MKSENIAVLAVAFCPDTDYFPKKPTPSLFQYVVFASKIAQFIQLLSLQLPLSLNNWTVLRKCKSGQI